MSVYTDVSAPALAEFLSHYDLGVPKALEGIGAGTENSNFFLQTDSGRYVLTLFERLPAAEIP